MPEAQVATIARKYGVTRWRVYDWRRRFRQGRLALTDGMAAMFAPLMVDEASEPRPAVARATAKLDIRVGDVVTGQRLRLTIWPV
jgi:transposase